MRLATAILLTLSGAAVASAATTTTYNPFKSADGWAYGNNQNPGYLSLDAENGTMTLDQKAWSQSYAYKTIETITLAKPTDSLTFSFTFRGNETGGMSLSLVGAEQTISIGSLSYADAGTQYAVHATVADTANHLKDAGIPAADMVDISTDLKLSETVNAITFTGAIAWNDEVSQYQLSISDGQNTLNQINLGAGVDVRKIHVTADGWGDRVYTFSDFSITTTSEIVPAPTTASLSLLALMGLMARRRRK